MTLIPARETLALRRHLAERLAAPVTMHLFQQSAPRPEFPDDGQACGETRDLLEEVATLSDRLRLELHDLAAEAGLAASLGVSRVPATVLVGAARGRVRWLGLPTGHELGALLGDLIDVSAGATSLRPASRRALAGLRRDLRLSVFVTPACPVCPAVARLAHQLAVESPRVSADVIEAAEFPDLLERFRVSGVPTVIVNERRAVVGAVDEAGFVRRVLAAA